jgi:YHS domain-containing protein
VIAFLWRVFLVALVIWLLYRLVLTWLKGRASSGSEETADTAARAPDGLHEMVQDKICQVYLPRNQALMLRQNGQEHFFCSVECKNKFLQNLGDRE